MIDIRTRTGRFGKISQASLRAMPMSNVATKSHKNLWNTTVYCNTGTAVCMVHCTESVGVQTLVLMHIVSADHIFVDCLPSPRGCLRPETSRGVVSSPLKCRDSIGFWPSASLLTIESFNAGRRLNPFEWLRVARPLLVDRCNDEPGRTRRPPQFFSV